MSLLNPIEFAKFAPNAVPGTWQAMEDAARKHCLTDPLVLAHWLGQNHHESAGFSKLVESLNYSVDGLLKTFGRHRISEDDARKFGRAVGRPAHQNALANILYGGAWGAKNLGNTERGDGWRFRGRGFKMITGRSNYARYGVVDTPDELLKPGPSADVSARFFVDAGCVPLALKNDIAGVTKRINGGAIGLAERVKLTTLAKRVTG